MGKGEEVSIQQTDFKSLLDTLPPIFDLWGPASLFSPMAMLCPSRQTPPYSALRSFLNPVPSLIFHWLILAAMPLKC